MMNTIRTMQRFVSTTNIRQVAKYHNSKQTIDPSFNYEITKNKIIKEKLEKEKDNYYKTVYLYNLYVNLQKENDYYTNMALKHAFKN